MASLPMQQVLRKYGLRLLPISDEGVVPGIVCARKRLQPKASLEQILEGKTGVWPTRLVQGLIVDNVVWEKSLSGKGSLNIPGIIDIGGGLSGAQKGTFSISKVTTRQLDSAALMEASLRVRLNEWRAQPGHRPMWRQIDDELFVESIWFCEEYSLDLATGSGANLKAEVAGNITVGGDAEVKWTSTTTLKVKGNTKVPFAVRVWQI
ncbi:MAG: hypothetical protein FJX75_07615 [Armatimonadetes bacterium]|nr:hypothetical protein [Armatimonadota bacterium]